MNKTLKKVLLCVGATALSSCSLLSPVKVEPPCKYVLDQLPAVAVRHTSAGTLLVMQPETRQVYNTTQMAYMTRPFQVGYFSQNEWGETPAQMEQPLLVETLQKTHFFHAIVTPPYIGNYDYTLYTEITEIYQDYTTRPAESVITVRAVLSRTTTNRVIAETQFTVEEPIIPQSPYNGVRAMNRANAQVLSKLTEFCIHKLGGGRRSYPGQG